MPSTLTADLSEQQLNTRLRRTDWRFLLPMPHPTRVLCRAGQDLTESVRSIAGELVTSGATGDCDLAVAEDPDDDTLGELFAALRPEGACYTEWRTGFAGGPTVERRLRAAGFTAVTCYRPSPPFPELPAYWIPLGAAGAEAYVRSRRRLRGGRLRRIGRAMLRLVRNLSRGRRWSPICAIARRPRDAQSSGITGYGWLEESWPELGLGSAPRRCSTLLVTGGPRSVSKVVLLGFAEPSPLPVIAVKTPRVDSAARGILQEGSALAGLTGNRSRVLPGVPRLLFRREIEGVPVLGETALVGRPLETLLTRSSITHWSIRVTDWLIALAADAAVQPAEHWRRSVIDPVLHRFGEQFGDVVDSGMLREAESIIRTIGPLSMIPEQRDFGPWNLLVTPAGEIAVLDWESATLDGLPALDLLYYLAYASFKVDRAHGLEDRIASYSRSLNPSTPTGIVRRDCICRYQSALGLDSERLSPLRVMVWLIHAQSDYEHATADAGGRPPADALKRSLFLALWREEMRLLAGG